MRTHFVRGVIVLLWATALSAGSYDWDGQSTTRFRVIPRERVVLVILIRPNGQEAWPPSKVP